MDAARSAPHGATGILLAEEAGHGSSLAHALSHNARRGMPGSTAGRAAQDIYPADAPILRLHLQLRFAQFFCELIDDRNAALLQGAADLIHLDVDARLLGNPLQLANGAGTAHAARNYGRFNTTLPRQAHDLGSEVRVEGIEDEQIRLEDP